MGKFNFTTNQLEAINLRDKNIIVSAQAGAGKTQVLVSRIIKLLIENRIDIRDMLIVTFTNKAANEMKDRIKFQISDIIQNSNDEKLIQYFQKQYTNINQAQISTLHSFGINILRKYFYKLGINPRFKILKDSNLNVVKWESMNEVFEDFYKSQNRDFEIFLRIYSKKYQDDDAKNILFNIYTFMQSQVKPFEWFDKALSKHHFKEFYSIKENYENLKNEIFENYFSIVKESINIYQNNISLIEKNNIYNFYEDTLLEDKKIIDNLKEINNLDDFFEFKKCNSFSKLPVKKIKDESVKKIRENIKKSINNYRDFIKKNILLSDIADMEQEIQKEIEYRNQQKHSLLIIKSILEKYDLVFKKKKFSNNEMDFNDIEHLLIELLDDEEVRNEISEKYKFIFFDEYQDANQIQNEIINSIASKNNLFFVGDIKQSIYKFRLADPLIFKKRYEDYKQDLTSNKVINLYENFRSERVLLDFNNFIFNNIMKEELGDVNYNTIEHRLKPGKDEASYDDSKAHINFSYIYTKKDYNDLDNNDIINMEINPEALLVAKKIQELIKNGRKYSDIAILSRTKTLFPDIIKVLEQNHIPYFYDASGFSFEDIELKVFIEILKAINNDTDDITLLSALTSTIANISDEELAHIRYDDKVHSFNYVFEHYKHRQDRKKEIVEKIEIYQTKMKKYRELQNVMSLQDFLWFVLIDSGYMSYVLAKVNGDKILNNIKKFISEVSDLESQTFQTLSSIINYVERIQDRKFGDRESASELSDEDNVVRLMTIHGSKGLQFKITFLVNLSRKFNTKDLNNNQILNNDAGISLKTYDKEKNKNVKSIFYQKIAQLKKKEIYSEEVRLLYVAMTRAIEEIHFISSGKNEKMNIQKDDYQEMNSYEQWIYSTISKDKIVESLELKNSDMKLDEFIFSSNIETNYFNNKNYNIEFEYYTQDNLFNNDISKDTILKNDIFNIKEDENIRIYNKVNGVMNFQYDDSLIDVPYKKTVTEINTESKNASYDYKDYEKLTKEYEEKSTLTIKPRFINSSVELDATQKGSLYHFIFEILPIKKMNDDEIHDFLNNLISKSIISKDEYDIIDKSVIKKFTETKIFERLINAEKNNKLYRETQFTMKYKENNHDIHVDGQVDVYFEEDNELVILDFKTNKKIDEEIYLKQLSLYQEGLEKATGKKVKEKLIYWVMFGEFTKIN